MKIKDLKVGDKMWGYNHPNYSYEVVKVTGYRTYLAIIHSSVQDTVCAANYNNKTCEEYGFFKKRVDMYDYRIAKAKQAWEHEIERKNLII